MTETTIASLDALLEEANNLTPAKPKPEPEPAKDPIPVPVSAPVAQPLVSPKVQTAPINPEPAPITADSPPVIDNTGLETAKPKRDKPKPKRNPAKKPETKSTNVAGVRVSTKPRPERTPDEKSESDKEVPNTKRVAKSANRPKPKPKPPAEPAKKPATKEKPVPASSVDRSKITKPTLTVDGRGTLKYIYPKRKAGRPKKQSYEQKLEEELVSGRFSVNEQTITNLAATGKSIREVESFLDLAKDAVRCDSKRLRAYNRGMSLFRHDLQQAANALMKKSPQLAIEYLRRHADFFKENSGVEESQQPKAWKDEEDTDLEYHK